MASVKFWGGGGDELSLELMPTTHFPHFGPYSTLDLSSLEMFALFLKKEISLTVRIYLKNLTENLFRILIKLTLLLKKNINWYGVDIT